jgi:hypothetical protein
MATNNFEYPLVNGKVIDGVYDDLSAINQGVARNFSNTTENRKLIEWILNHLSGEWHWEDLSAAWQEGPVSLEYSKSYPEKFFYWEEN